MTPAEISQAAQALFVGRKKPETNWIVDPRPS